MTDKIIDFPDSGNMRMRNIMERASEAFARDYPNPKRKRGQALPPETIQWAFKPRFRRHAFGWKSQPAIIRIKEAVKEIKTVARTNPVEAADGAVQFLQRLSPAIEQVDGSSGSIGFAQMIDRALKQALSHAQ